MQISAYVIYELLVRLNELDPQVGSYESYQKIKGGVLVFSSGGNLMVPEYLLEQQFRSPDLIKLIELSTVLASFTPHS
jgi:hypothetical protein